MIVRRIDRWADSIDVAFGVGEFLNSQRDEDHPREPLPVQGRVYQSSPESIADVGNTLCDRSQQ